MLEHGIFVTAWDVVAWTMLSIGLGYCIAKRHELLDRVVDYFQPDPFADVPRPEYQPRSNLKLVYGVPMSEPSDHLFDNEHPFDWETEGL